MTHHRLILLVVILIAFALRVWQLPHLPPGLWYDEAYNGLDARWMAETGHTPVFFVGNNGREPLIHYLWLLSTSLLGNIPFAGRWVGAVAGVVTIPLVYCFAYLLLHPFANAKRVSHRRWLALTAAGWVAVSWWHLLNSRSGLRPILLPPLLMLSLYFFMKGCKVGSEAGKSVEGPIINPQSAIRNPLSSFILSGIFLGLSQYTYLSARLAPLIFGSLLILWTILIFLKKKGRHWSLVMSHSSFGILWLGPITTALTALLIFLPLGFFFLKNPETLSARTGDVLFAPKNFTELIRHLGQAVSLFFGAGHELYRHHLPGRAMLGWLEIPFFWLGLIFLLRPTHLRRPEAQLLLIGLVVMWLPTLLASPPIHALRAIGLLPFYYLIVTLGGYWLASSLGSRHAKRAGSRKQAAGGREQGAGSKSASELVTNTQYATRNTQHAIRFTFYVLLLTPLLANGLINTYDYFQRWATHPEVYKEYNGPLVDLTEHLRTLTKTHDVLIPFHLYLHPTTRYLLGDDFPEINGNSPQFKRPLELLLIPDTFQLLYVGNIPTSPAMVLLTRAETGQGAAYVSRPPRAAEQQALNDLRAPLQLYPFKDRLHRTVAQFVSIPTPNPQSLTPNPHSPLPTPHSPLPTLFDPTPLRLIDLTWSDQAQLTGYDVTPNPVQPGQPLTLNLYWHSLTDKPFEATLFIQLINTADQPFNQWEQDAFREDMYRWRPAGLLPTQHILWLAPNTPPGPYLLRLGFFDPETGERLPVVTGGKAGGLEGWRAGGLGASPDGIPIDQMQLGLFYVNNDGSDLPQPEIPLSVTFAEFTQLTGVTIPNLQSPNLQSPNPHLPITFFWQSLQPTPHPQTVFLQLLNAQGEVVSSWDSQPFNGLYPTSLWSPGETIVDTFTLPLPDTGLPPGQYRLISGFYDFETGQRLPIGGGGDFAVLAEFGVE